MSLTICIPSKTCYFSLFLFFLFTACKSSKTFSGFSYDPTGASETITKPIITQHKRTIGIEAEGVWASNEFAGARLSDFYQKNDTLYEAFIKPEIVPVNDSPWYAFRMRARHDTTVWVEISYRHGTHRYIPKLSRDKHHWKRIEPKNYRVNANDSTAYMQLHLQKKPLFISAQELITQHWFNAWTDSMMEKDFIHRDTVGFSHEHRPIQRIRISEVPHGERRGVVIITGRLHPPEVTGNLACYHFLETLSANTPLAQHFRRHFEIISYPFVNPDGVHDGHWRTNGGGADLNRDWKKFNQPETQAIRDDLIHLLKNNALATVYYGIDFHSTDENIFYPISRKVHTFPEDFSYQWLDTLTAAFPHTHFSIEPFDTSAPITKNWLYHAFGIDALTYEVNDQANRKKLQEISQKAARLLMKQLLAIQKSQN